MSATTYLRRLLAVVLVLTLVAACGADDETTDTTYNSSTESSTSGVISDECPIPTPAENTTIDLIGWEFPATAEIANEFADCNSNNLQINVQLLDNATAQDQIALDFATGARVRDRPRHRLACRNVGRQPGRPDNAYRSISGGVWIDDIPQSMWDGATVDGRILGVPLFFQHDALFYNTEILDANGVSAPDNYDEVIEACGVLQDAGFDDPFNMNLSANWAWEIEFSNILKSLGGNILNDDNTAGWNTPEGLRP